MKLAFDAEHEAVLQAEARRDRLEVAMAADSEFTRVVHRLGCLRGVSTLTAFGLAVEVGDWDGLTGASIGLTPVTVDMLLPGPETRTA